MEAGSRGGESLRRALRDGREEEEEEEESERKRARGLFSSVVGSGSLIFRDGGIWRGDDEMIIGSRGSREAGRVLLFRRGARLLVVVLVDNNAESF